MTETMGREICLRTSATLFHLLCLSSLVIANKIYYPHDLYSISCGSSHNFHQDGRNWTADTSSGTKLLIDESASSVAATTLAQLTTQDTYFLSARLSHSQFTYSFPVSSPGPKFIRLFFNPTSYPNFDPAKAYFSVKSGEYTLLKDFNASLYAITDDDQYSDTFFREYSICVQDGEDRLNVTFIPSIHNNNGTSSEDLYYAFINGIEVVSMPPYLYYTRPGESDDEEPQLVGPNTPYPLENSAALETKYRLGVGRSTISAAGDTGMLRYWDVDERYLASGNDTLASEYNEVTKIMFTDKVPNYTAPETLYRTLRHMGKNATINLSYNLTWELPVDPGFFYMLRLHFCELDPGINKIGDRGFFIFIQDQVAEQDADVLRWTNEEKGVPVFKDYAVIVPSNKPKNTNISLKMHPHPDTYYVDAVLNGLELFKISDQQHNLAGPNPDPPPPKTPPTLQVPPPKKSNKKTLATVAGAVSGVILLFLLVVVAFFLVKPKKKSYYYAGYNGSKHKSEGSASSLPTNLCRHFSIEEVRTATNNFDELFVVGVGGFGNVYKGYIDDGVTPVAIKRLKPDSQQGAHEFLNEIEMLSRLRHLHLVSLIGYCYQSNEMILVYDFIARGTLRDHLYNNNGDPSLSWKERLEVCIGAARGLHYLHTGVKHMIIHRDVKSTNILLDEKWVAKVSDFGLSRVGPTGNSVTHVSTVVKGSVGYLDPEYYKRQRLTEKSDVYSFGVVLLEVLCGRPPLLRNVEKQQVSLVDWARRCYNTGSLGKIVDPKLKGDIAFECLKKFGELAMSCLHDDGTQRPSMNDVVGVLEFVLQLQENSVSKGVNVELAEWDSDVFSSSTSSRNVTSVSMTSSGDNRSKESSWLMSENVFSEIGDPKGR